MKKLFWWGIGVGLSLGALVFWQWPDGHLHVIACDVGQGDAFLITQGFDQVLVDGGPVEGNVVSCLGRHMPFWDTTLEMVVSTHPDLDHYGGLIDVVSRYQVGTLVAPDLVKDTKQFKIFQEEVWRNAVNVQIARSGQVLTLANMRWEILWPNEKYHDGQAWVEKSGVTMEGQPEDTNDGSIVMLLQYKGFSAWFTGDAPLMVEHALLSSGLVHKVAYLKVSHHGSKTGTSSELLENLKPDLAVIGVGKGNRYGHPTNEVLERLQKAGVVMRRTDLDGEIEVVSDGERWWEK